MGGKAGAEWMAATGMASMPALSAQHAKYWVRLSAIVDLIGTSATSCMVLLGGLVVLFVCMVQLAVGGARVWQSAASFLVCPRPE